LSILLVTILQKKLRFFKFADYRKVAYYWLMTATIFGLLIQVNFFLASGLALLAYFLLILFAQKSSEKDVDRKVF
jgi:hypothetical protein